MDLIRRYRDWRRYLVQNLYSSQVADAEAELSALRRRGFEASWMFPALAACGLVWLGHSIGQVAGALAGAVIAFFYGMAHITKAKSAHEAELFAAQNAIEELRKEHVEYERESK